MKICSLLPSGTEVLYALGLGDQLIGVSDLCDYPPEAQSKPVVSRSKVDPNALSSDQVEEVMQRLLATGESPYDLDSDWIMEQGPDVVLTQDLCYFCEVDAGQVRDVAVAMPQPPEVVVLQPRTVAEVFESFLQVGKACGADSEAKRMVDDLRERCGAITVRLKGLNKVPRVFSLEGINPIVIGGHWIPELLGLAGGRQEMFPPGSPAARPEWKDICAWAPEKLFIDLCSSDLARGLREIPWLAAQDGWTRLPAVQAGEVYLIDHVYFSRPGPRIVQGLEILAQLTHPDIFSGLIPSNTVAKLDPDLAAEHPPQQIAECFRPFPC
jgi:iron complex transport system substrate-binding protein